MESFDIVLIGFPKGVRNADSAVAGIQNIFGVDEATAQRFVTNLPRVVRRGASRSEAQKFYNAFAHIGGKVEFRPSGAPEQSSVHTSGPHVAAPTSGTYEEAGRPITANSRPAPTSDAVAQSSSAPQPPAVGGGSTLHMANADNAGWTLAGHSAMSAEIASAQESPQPTAGRPATSSSSSEPPTQILPGNDLEAVGAAAAFAAASSMGIRPEAEPAPQVESRMDPFAEHGPATVQAAPGATLLSDDFDPLPRPVASGATMAPVGVETVSPIGGPTMPPGGGPTFPPGGGPTMPPGGMTMPPGAATIPPLSLEHTAPIDPLDEGSLDDVPLPRPSGAMQSPFGAPIGGAQEPLRPSQDLSPRQLQDSGPSPAVSGELPDLSPSMMQSFGVGSGQVAAAPPTPEQSPFGAPASASSDAFGAAAPVSANPFGDPFGAAPAVSPPAGAVPSSNDAGAAMPFPDPFAAPVQGGLGTADTMAPRPSGEMELDFSGESLAVPSPGSGARDLDFSSAAAALPTARTTNNFEAATYVEASGNYPTAQPHPSIVDDGNVDFYSAIPEMMVLPLRGPGLTWLISITAVQFLTMFGSAFVMIAMPIFGLIFVMIATAALLALLGKYFQACLWSTVHREDEPNNMPDFSEIKSELITPGLSLTIFAIVVTLGPMWMWSTHLLREGVLNPFSSPITWLLLVLPVIYWPIGLAMCAESNSFMSIWNLPRGFLGIARVPLKYGVVVLMGIIAFILPIVLSGVLMRSSAGVLMQLVGILIAAVPTAYSHGVMGALMGKLIRRHPEILGLG